MAAVTISGLGFPVLAFIEDFSISGSYGGETGAEVASVGGYVLGGETCAGLGAFASSCWACGPEVLLSELVIVASLTGSRLGSLSWPLPSTMGVRARRCDSDPDEPKPRDGRRGREVVPSCGIPVAGPSVEEREVNVGGTLGFDSLEFALGGEGACIRRERMLKREDRTTDVRSFRGSMVSAVSRSKKSD